MTRSVTCFLLIQKPASVGAPNLGSPVDRLSANANRLQLRTVRICTNLLAARALALVVSMLSVTGIVIWFKKRSARLDAARHAAPCTPSRATVFQESFKCHWSTKTPTDRCMRSRVRPDSSMRATRASFQPAKFHVPGPRQPIIRTRAVVLCATTTLWPATPSEAVWTWSAQCA